MTILSTIALMAGLAHGAGDFLRQDSSARGAALGGAMTALTDDTSSLQWNPAGLARMAKPEASFTHVTLFEETSWDFGAGGFNSPRWGSFAGGFVRQSVGGFEKRAGPNDTPTTFSIDQTALLAGWGRAFPYVDAGFSVKSVKETIDARGASGFGADIGAIARPPGGRWLVGLRVANALAPSLTFVREPVGYARTIELSPAYAWPLGRALAGRVALKLAKTDGESAEVSGGVELQYTKLASLRLGGQSKGLSTGFGIRVGNTSFDYAALLHELGVSHMLTIVQRFGHTREELEETIRRGIQELTQAEGTRLAKAYLEKADDELRMDRAQEALRDLEAASLLDPSNESIKAKIRAVSERWDRTLRRQMADRTAALAQQQQQQGNLLAARQYWKSVQELDPDYAQAQEALADIDRTLSRDERDKLEDLRRAQSVNEAQQAVAVASSYLARGKYRQARLEAEKAAAKFPGAPELPAFILRVRQELGDWVSGQIAAAESAAEQGKYDEALRVVESAMKEDPGNARLSERAVTYRGKLQAKLTPEGRKQVEQLYYRAVEQYLKGDLKAAGELAAEVNRLDPTYEAARTLRDKIDAAARYSR